MTSGIFEIDWQTRQGKTNAPPAAVGVAPLLQAPSPVTRERAILVLRSLAGELPGPPALAGALARYDPYARQAEREAAAEEIIGLLGA